MPGAPDFRQNRCTNRCTKISKSQKQHQSSIKSNLLELLATAAGGGDCWCLDNIPNKPPEDELEGLPVCTFSVTSVEGTVWRFLVLSCCIS
jgi:hypothetical protein